MLRKQSHIVAEKFKLYISYEIKIKDTGVGISKEGLKHLFVDFGKLGENEQFNPRGTGLGLSICK